MTESQFTQLLLKALRQRLPYAVVLKHINPLTKGVPDFSLTRYVSDSESSMRTTWCEVKLASGQLFPALQFETARRMDAWYIIYSPQLRKAWLFKARERDGWASGPQYTFAELVEKIVRLF